MTDSCKCSNIHWPTQLCGVTILSVIGKNVQDLVAIYKKNAVARFNKGTKVKSSSVSNESASMTVYILSKTRWC